MKQFNLKISILFIASAMIFASCKKEGPVGPAGTNGQDGNANVSSNTYTVNTGNWTLSGYIYFVDISVPAITSDISNTGSVQVFMESTSSPGVWLNMPWTEWFANYFSTYNYNYGTGAVRIFKADSDLEAPTNPGTRRFKVVTIESSGIIANPDIDWTDYNQIRERFDLTE